MTQEEKQLLLKDLCARLPYGVQCQCEGCEEIFTLIGIGIIETEITGSIQIYYDCYDKYGSDYQLDLCKPYLRPMSDMTEEEYKEYKGWIDAVHNSPAVQTDGYIDWLNAHHFDYRGFIKKGLALEAPEDMYALDNLTPYEDPDKGLTQKLNELICEGGDEPKANLLPSVGQDVNKMYN